MYSATYVNKEFEKNYRSKNLDLKLCLYQRLSEVGVCLMQSNINKLKQIYLNNFVIRKIYVISTASIEASVILDVDQGLATFFALRTGLSLVIFLRTGFMTLIQ